MMIERYGNYAYIWLGTQVKEVDGTNILFIYYNFLSFIKTNLYFF